MSQDSGRGSFGAEHRSRYVGLKRARMSRRRFLGLGAAAVAGAATAGFGLPSGHLRAATHNVPFFEPEVRVSRGGVLETSLQAAVTPVPVAGGTAITSVYDGSYPAPTLWVRPGDLLKIHLVNGLDETTNLHTHGFHVSPLPPSDDVLLHIMPGETYDFGFAIPANHPAGTFWYHPHFHGMANEQVFGGMAGVIIVEGDLDHLPGVAGLWQHLLVLTAIELGSDDRVLPPDQRNQANFQRLVNGQSNPTISIRPNETQRWRIANASASTFYNLQLDGHQFHQIAKDGNTLAQVWTRDQIVMGPGERVEVLIQGGPAGTYALRTLPFAMGGGAVEPEVVLATLVSEGQGHGGRPLPTSLLPFDDLSKARIDKQRSITFQVKPNKVFEIDNQQFDENRVDQLVQLGATEEWVINNDSNVWHPFHIHVNDYPLTAINGQPVTAYGYEDTTPVPPHGSITMRTRFLDYVGKFVYHCHILPHEDGGMMGIVEVVGPNARPGTASQLAANPYYCALPGPGGGANLTVADDRGIHSSHATHNVPRTG
jgi:suppressor of ftsI